ncbi:MAG TPA: hypothetical protein VK280_01060 [Streptosporangiaceae bacterium]|nr:hypothetical protein [Streptosporangiaceae bacterium]
MTGSGTRQRLQLALREALRDWDAIGVSALRSALGAIDNASALGAIDNASAVSPAPAPASCS